MKLFIILIILSILVGTISIVKFIKYKKNISKIIKQTRDGKHFCNYCELAYIITKNEREQKYCSDCYRPLTLHKLHPDFNENPNESEQTDSPFKDFQ